MKKLLFLAAALILACTTLGAQTPSDFHFKNGKYWQNGVKLSPEQLYSVIGEEAYNKAYKPAKALRTSGIVILSVGGATTVAGLGMLAYYVAKSADPSGGAGDAVMAIPSVVLTGTGAALTIVGGVLLGIGNAKLRKITPASSGAGIAFNF